MKLSIEVWNKYSEAMPDLSRVTIHQIISYLSVHVFDIAFTIGIFPKQMKTAQILSAFIQEKLFAVGLSSWLSDHSILTEFLYGFKIVLMVNELCSVQIVRKCYISA